MLYCCPLKLRCAILIVRIAHKQALRILFSKSKPTLRRPMNRHSSIREGINFVYATPFCLHKYSRPIVGIFLNAFPILFYGSIVPLLSQHHIGNNSIDHGRWNTAIFRYTLPMRSRFTNIINNGCRIFDVIPGSECQQVVSGNIIELLID